MSVSYSILVKTELPTDSVVSEVESILNCRLRHTFNRRHYYSEVVLGVGFSVVTTVPYDDDEIKYSEYQYEIMIEYKGEFDRQFSNEVRELMTLVLANMLSTNAKCDCLAVRELTDILGDFHSQVE